LKKHYKSLKRNMNHPKPKRFFKEEKKKKKINKKKKTF